MEFFQFCLEIINREVKKFNVGFDTSGLKKLTIDSANNANYDLIKKRCHFLYRCGTINLYFANVCFKTFLMDHNILQDLSSKWNNCVDLTFCSISTGPALDYIAFIHSFQESGIIPPSFKNVKIVTKHGAWRNSANTICEIIREGYLKSLPIVGIGKINVLQGDPIKNFVQKIKSSVNSADVVMMMKRLNLKANNANEYKKKEVSEFIQVFLDALKPGAILFCMDTKLSIKAITQELNLLPGTFLLKPTPMMTVMNFDYPKVIQEHIGCLPIISTEGSFFVWQKSSVSSHCLEGIVNDISDSRKHKLNFNDVADKKCYSSEVSGLKSNYTQQNITKPLNLKGNVHQLVNDAKNCPDYSCNYLPSTSSQNACIQTEPDDILLESDTKKVMELVHRVQNLTTELTEMLENNEPSYCTNECFKISQDTCECLVPKDDLHDQCSSVVSSTRFSESLKNCGKCCQYHALSQCCFPSNNAKMKTPSYFEGSSFNNPSGNHTSITSGQSNVLSSAQLVIPLTNLSADIVSQIISLITQSEQKPINVIHQKS